MPAIESLEARLEKYYCQVFQQFYMECAEKVDEDNEEEQTQVRELGW